MSPSRRNLVWLAVLFTAAGALATAHRYGRLPQLDALVAIAPVPVIAYAFDRSIGRALSMTFAVALAILLALASGSAILPAAGAAWLIADRFGRSEDALRTAIAFAGACAITIGLLVDLRYEISIPLMLGAIAAIPIGLVAPKASEQTGFDRWSPATFWCLAAATFVLTIDRERWSGALLMALAAGWVGAVAPLLSLAGALLAGSALSPELALPIVFLWARSGASMAELRSRELSIPAELATCFGAGYTPKGSGTVGALTAIPIGWLLSLIDPIARGAILAAACAAGIGICYWYMSKRTGSLDPKEVVLDEHLGVLIAFAVIPWEWPWIAAAFALFRLFDIWKPWPVGWLDRHVKSPAGVMIDDYAAGLMAAALLFAARGSLHTFFS